MGSECVSAEPTVVPASPVVSPPPRLGNSPTSGLVCPECNARWPKQASLSQHRRRKHPEAYHKERESYEKKRKGWSDEELRLLALSHASLLDSDPGLSKTQYSKLLFNMHDKGYKRTGEQIRQCITKSAKYDDALRAVLERSTSPPQTSPSRNESVQQPEPTGVTAPVQSQVSWSHALKMGFVTFLLATVSFSEVVPGFAGAHSQRIVDEDFLAWLPVIPPKVFKGFKQSKLPIKKRPRRRAQYRRMQKLWIRNRRRCLDSVLSGAWEKDSPDIDEDAFYRFWENILRTESRPDPRDVEPVRPVQWALMDPVVEKDIEEALRSMDPKTAAGPDFRDLKAVKEIPKAELVARFNLWLYTGCLPSQMYGGCTSFIPKSPGTNNPAEHRPITVPPVIVRLFHSILAKRLEALCPPSERQKAFRKGDGIAENIEVFKETLKYAQDPKKPKDLYVAFLDVRKAFDSVSHQSLALASKRAGVPEPLIKYIENLYRNASTQLKVGSTLKDPISVLQGVRQGDPLSPILFNYIIDWALSNLDSHIGFKVDGIRMNHLAFADDVALFASSPQGLQRQIQLFSEHLAQSGLFLNPDKCRTLGIKVVGGRERRTWVVSSEEFAKVNGSGIRTMGVEDTYKYLGIHMTYKGQASGAGEKLQKNLNSLTKAPLKPQQRMWMLNTSVLPALFHELVLSECTYGYVESLDLMIRAAVRSWLKLPRDTVLPYFYAAVPDGGLGVVSLRYQVFQQKVDRLVKLEASQDALVRKICGLGHYAKKLRKYRKGCLLDGEALTSASIRRQVWARKLVGTVDCRGLRHSSLVPQVHDWVRDGTLMLSGAKYNAAIALRGATLPTRVRASRGRGTPLPNCDVCGPPEKESLSHMVQKCPRTHGARVKRHDRVLSVAENELSKRGYTTLVEPHIQTSEGMRKPDLIVFSRERGIAAVIDVAICSDDYELNDAHFLKVEKYSKHPEIKEYVSALSGGREPFFSSITINWRGAVAPQTAVDLKTLGFTLRILKLLSVIVCEQSAIIHRLWQTSTATGIWAAEDYFEPP